MVTKSQAIRNFLLAKTHEDLANDYGINMECQVNVGQDGGERIDGEFKGRAWQAWTDGLQVWKPFRIPYEPNKEPNFDDPELSWDLVKHAEGIGMTGWDWANRCSKWVAFDFDSIVGHSSGLEQSDIEEVRKAAFNIDWVTIRKSTSGTGLHLYVYLDEVSTDNHNEHASLARAILGQMSALTGFDFNSKIDVCGGNMWVWHRKMEGTDGLTKLKSGTVLKDVPPNWRDHLKVIKGKKLKNLPQDLEEQVGSLFEELSGQRPHVKLDEEHKRLINYLKQENARWWWESDHHMLVTHTFFLKQAHEELGLKGFFNTNAAGKEAPEDHNCFMFPMRRGAWAIRRYSPGIQEHESWSQDGQGWTKCYYNKEPDLRTACRAYGAVEDDDGGFSFRDAETAAKAAGLLDIHINIPNYATTRPAKLKKHKDGRLLINMEYNQNDRPEDMQGWLNKKNKGWQQIFNKKIDSESETEVGNYDDLVRHIVTPNDEDSGWTIRTDERWRIEPKDNIKLSLKSLGIAAKDIDIILGSSVFKPFTLVNKPFQPEYPGDRQWNRNGAQLRFSPSQDEDLRYPTWQKILSHSGSGLDYSISKDPWCKANGILTGADYLKCWIASLIQEPEQPLPYLFFYGQEKTGKSIFHEALALLFTRGYTRADEALTNTSGFNAELEGQVLCVIEETNINASNIALNRIKDWVTSGDLMIHAKTKTPYHIKNTTHYVQCANNIDYCPVFPGDTRITVIYVEPLKAVNMIPKKRLIPQLEKEAPDFLASVLNLELPESPDRLNIPVVSTGEKSSAESMNRNPIQEFIEEECCSVKGEAIRLGDFFDKFIRWIDKSRLSRWDTKHKVSKHLPPQYPKGRLRKDNHVYIGNLSFTPSEDKDYRYVLEGDHLVEVPNDR